MEFNYQKSPLYKNYSIQKNIYFKLANFIYPFLIIAAPVLISFFFYFRLEILFYLSIVDLILLLLTTYIAVAFSGKTPLLTVALWQKSGNKNDSSLVMGMSVVRLFTLAKKLSKTTSENFNPNFLLSAIRKDIEGQEIMVRLGIGFDENDLNSSSSETQNDEWQKITADAINFCLESGGEYLEIEDFLYSLAKNNDLFIRLLKYFNLNEEAVAKAADWYRRIRKSRQTMPFWQRPVIDSIGEDWNFGYTRILSSVAQNISKLVLNLGEIRIFGKASDLDSAERILARSGKNNVLLVGDVGVGKKTIVYALARKIIDGKAEKKLAHKKILQINVGSIISGASTPGEVAGRIESIMREAIYVGNIIIFFENFHTLVSSESSESAIDVSEILLPYLQSSRVQVIGTTDTANYHKNVEASPGIVEAFERIDIAEPDEDESLKILEENIYFFENRYNIVYTLPSLLEIIKLSKRYIHDKAFPQKAIDLADEIALKVSSAGRSMVVPDDVDKIVSERSHVPVGEASEQEKTKLSNLEPQLHKRIVGQNEAISAVANALRRARSGISNQERPLGTFLFIGPTGVGKTETAKALAQIYYGAESNMIRLDMSEYQDSLSISKLIGSPAAAGAESQLGILTSAVHDHPFSLVLLDELEKAHPNIITLFLQVLDDGRLTDGTGRLIDFKNTIIIATSNAGSELIRENIQSGNDDMDKLKNILLDYLQKNGIYKTEFINRFDGVILFKPLTVAEIGQIVGIMIAELNTKLKEKDISVRLSPEALGYIVQKGYDPVFGARPMRRIIQDKVENMIAKKLLDGSLAKGAEVELSLADISAE